MNHPRTLVLALLSMALVAAPPAVAGAKKKPKPPKRTVVTKLLGAHYNDTLYPQSKKTQWKPVSKVKFGKAFKTRNYLKYGVPSNGKKTTVFPLKLKSRYTACYSNGDVVVDQIKAKYFFFKDEFGDWTFRIDSEQRTQPPADKRPAGTKCPFPVPFAITG